MIKGSVIVLDLGGNNFMAQSTERSHWNCWGVSPGHAMQELLDFTRTSLADLEETPDELLTPDAIEQREFLRKFLEEPEYDEDEEYDEGEEDDDV